MSTARRVHHSYQAYLDVLEVSPVKLEYLEGEIFAMAGGTPAHADLAAAMIAALTRTLGADCRVSTSDLKVRIEATDLSTFPDVTVTCGERLASSVDRNAVTNPTLLVEVTSDSTEEYDRGEKLRHYKQLQSLTAVLIVSHRLQEITIVERTPGGFREWTVCAGSEVTLRDPGCRFEVDDVYRGITLAADVS